MGLVGRWFLEGLGDYMLFVRVLSLHVARASGLERSLGSKYVKKHGCAAPAPVYGFTRLPKLARLVNFETLRKFEKLGKSEEFETLGMLEALGTLREFEKFWKFAMLGDF